MAVGLETGPTGIQNTPAAKRAGGPSPPGSCGRVAEKLLKDHDWAPGFIDVDSMVLSLQEDGHEPLEEPRCTNVESVFIAQHRKAQANRTSPTTPRAPVYYVTVGAPAGKGSTQESSPGPEVDMAMSSGDSDDMDDGDVDAPSAPADADPMPWEVNPRRIRDLVSDVDPAPQMLYAEWRALGIRAYGDWETALRRLTPTARRRLAAGVRMPRTTMVAASSPFIKQCVEFARALEARPPPLRKEPSAEDGLRRVEPASTLHADNAEPTADMEPRWPWSIFASSTTASCTNSAICSPG